MVNKTTGLYLQKASVWERSVINYTIKYLGIVYKQNHNILTFIYRKFISVKRNIFCFDSDLLK